MKRLIEWEELPDLMRTKEVYTYYCILKRKEKTLVIKRIFDIVVSFLMIIVLMPIMIILSVWIKADSKGPIFFRQVRVTQYGRKFKIIKFRTMIEDAERLGNLVTVNNDIRITKAGQKLRNLRLDELPQLFNILIGDMSFVGTRPEVPKYICHYSAEMRATLLMPAGVTSEASIRYKDEKIILQDLENTEKSYIEEVLPKKMEYNLAMLKTFGLWKDIKILIKTVIAVVR